MDLYDRATETEEWFRAQALRRQAERMPRGASAMDCVECGEPIPEERRRALPGVTRCVDCERDRERRMRR